MNSIQADDQRTRPGASEDRHEPCPQIRPTAFGGSIKFLQTAESAVANTATATSLWGTGQGNRTFGPNTLSKNLILRFVQRGRLSNSATRQLTIAVTLGSVTASKSLNVAAATGANAGDWELDVTGVVRRVGTAGAIVLDGRFSWIEGGTIVKAVPLFAAAAIELPIDTAVENVFETTARWGSVGGSLQSTFGMVSMELPPP